MVDGHASLGNRQVIMVLMNMTRVFVDALGWSGAAVLLAAYAGVSFGKMRPNSAGYQFANAFGGICLVVNTVYYHAYPSAFVNVVWIGIAAAAWARLKGSSHREVKEVIGQGLG